MNWDTNKDSKDSDGMSSLSKDELRDVIDAVSKPAAFLLDKSLADGKDTVVMGAGYINTETGDRRYMEIRIMARTEQQMMDKHKDERNML